MNIFHSSIRNSRLDYLSLLSLSAAKRLNHSSISLGPNDVVSTTYENRNPRNLEKLRIAYKPKGYHLEKPFRNFWHKLEITRTGRHLSAAIVHYTGPVVISASTTEWCIRKYLYRTNDTSAYVNLAKVLSHRCLESGILEMKTDYFSEAPKSKKVALFLNEMENNGIILVEPERFEGYKPWDQHRPEKPWEIVED
ncbi:hypothetical protein J437_LFUL013892 [Ladona fulva]|uniref:Large ribosomal subunit protein uL18m n=1 Tax=Ladona fulva TaxID=123851 RepID=A0A8K0KSI6_LADFU|nr:hypothetical protein J437_LFUL013892 [Ladona fulva]